MILIFCPSIGYFLLKGIDIQIPYLYIFYLYQDVDLIIISIKKADGSMFFNSKASYQFEAGDVLHVPSTPSTRI